MVSRSLPPTPSVAACASVGALRFLADMSKKIVCRLPVSAAYIPLKQARWSHDGIRFGNSRRKLCSVSRIVRWAFEKRFKLYVILKPQILPVSIP